MSTDRIGILLYARSAEDRERFMKLRETVAAMQEPANRQRLLDLAEAELRNVYVRLYKMRIADGPDLLALFRTESHGVLTSLLHSLALLNGTYYTRGFGKNKEQLLLLPIRPARLKEFMEGIMHYPDRMKGSAYDRAGLPRLMEQLDSRDLNPLRQTVERLSYRLEEHLRMKGVAILRYADIATFSNYLEETAPKN